MRDGRGHNASYLKPGMEHPQLLTPVSPLWSPPRVEGSSGDSREDEKLGGREGGGAAEKSSGGGRASSGSRRFGAATAQHGTEVPQREKQVTLLDVDSKGQKAGARRGICTPMFTAASLTVADRQGCPSTLQDPCSGTQLSLKRGDILTHDEP